MNPESTARGKKSYVFLVCGAEFRLDRAAEFRHLYDCHERLEHPGGSPRGGYSRAAMGRGYSDVVAHHSTDARATTILREARRRGIPRT
jgi:hypothetical protein